MHLSQLNKHYWQNSPAGETTSIDVKPTRAVLARFPPQARVLDVGTGDGRLAEWLSRQGFDVVGIDINTHEIEATRHRETSVDYQVQDIAVGTVFQDSFFDLLCFRFTLCNIHRDEWDALAREVDRLTAARGYVWLVEPLVSPSYTERYRLAREVSDDEHALFVFKDKDAARTISTKGQLRDAIEQGAVSRISRHFTVSEIKTIFSSFDLVSRKKVKLISPSGFTIDTFVALFQKKIP